MFNLSFYTHTCYLLPLWFNRIQFWSLGWVLKCTWAQAFTFLFRIIFQTWLKDTSTLHGTSCLHSCFIVNSSEMCSRPEQTARKLYLVSSPTHVQQRLQVYKHKFTPTPETLCRVTKNSFLSWSGSWCWWGIGSTGDSRDVELLQFL